MRTRRGSAHLRDGEPNRLTLLCSGGKVATTYGGKGRAVAGELAVSVRGWGHGVWMASRPLSR